MRLVGVLVAIVVALTLAGPVAGAGELRIDDIDVFLNDHDLTVHVVALGAVPRGFVESLQSGIPSLMRFTVELWRYKRMWRDSLVIARVVERQLQYNVVTKEYKVAPVRGDAGPSYTTRDLGDAQRALAEVRSLKLAPSSRLDAADVFYVRVLAETALRGESTWVARMSGTAERATRRSDYRTLMRSE